MAIPQHRPRSSARWHVAVDAELRHLRRNLRNASMAAELHTLLDGAVTRPGVPAWMTAMSPTLRTPAARMSRLATTAVYAVAAATAGGAVAQADHRVTVAVVAALAVVAAMVLVVEVPLHRARPLVLRTDAARYLVAEAVLAARDIATGPAAPTRGPGADVVLAEVVRTARRLDAAVVRTGPAADPAWITARNAWLLEQVAELRVTAQRTNALRPDAVVGGT